MYNKQDILMTAQLLGVTFDKFSIDDLVTGVNIEMEHELLIHRQMLQIMI